ncbi:MAG: glycoside hydrolase domain-containing protein [Acidobacteriaceae bacterium]
MYSTHDEGNTFQKVDLTAQTELGSVNNPTYDLPIFEDSHHGFERVTYSGGNGSKSVAVLFVTTDSGRTWKVDAILSNLPESSMGQTVVSTVADNTWIIPFTPRGAQPKLLQLNPYDKAAAAGDLSSGYFGGHRITFATPTEGWLTSNRRLLSTTDGGATWTEITPGKHPTNWFQVPSTMAKPLAGGTSTNSTMTQAAATPGFASNGISQHLGFDRRFVISVADMQTWWNSSPYFDVGFYPNGAVSHPTDTHLNASWVAAVSAQGWGLIPIWSGPQAPCACYGGGAYPSCNSFPHTFSSDPATAMAQGVAQADAAIASVQSLGLDGQVIYVDVENYSSTACGSAVQGYVSGWTQEMATQGGEGGVYGGTYDAVDFAAAQPTPADVWFPRYDDHITVWNLSYNLSTGLSDSMWPNRQRIHQYMGGSPGGVPYSETWGGVTHKIDVDIDDAAIDAGNGVKNYSFTEAAGTGFPTAINDAMMPPNNYPVGTIVGFSDDDGLIANGWTAASVLDYPGAEETELAGINNMGQVVGGYLLVNPDGSTTWHGLFYDPQEGFSTLDYPGADETFLYGINDAGWVTGIWEAGDSFFCLLYKAGQFVSFDMGDSTCESVNGQGEIVSNGGLLYDVESGDPGNPVNIIGLPFSGTSINNNGQVLGNASGGQTYLFDSSGQIIGLPLQGSVYGINDEVQIVGYPAAILVPTN